MTKVGTNGNTLLAKKCCCFIFGFRTANEKTKHSDKFSHVRTQKFNLLFISPCARLESPELQTFGMRRTFVLLCGMSISGSWAVAVPTIDWCSRNILGALLGRQYSLPSPLNNATIIGHHGDLSQYDCSQHQFISPTPLIRDPGASATINEAINALNLIPRSPVLYIARLTSMANICFSAS